MPDTQKIIDDLKLARDEVRLRIHLASMEAQSQWDELEKRWNKFSSKAELHQSGKELSTTLKTLGSELKDAYVRLRKAV
jgi:hypothetical protein